MVSEAKVEKTDKGLRPEGEGWYVVNAADCVWIANEKFGSVCHLEGGQKFQQLGINIHVIKPGQPSCYYHGEADQEDFLVLSGECILLIEGQERHLKAWDFVHCPPWAEHVFVGKGDQPCAILMVGARSGGGVVYPDSDLAKKYQAGAKEKTDSPKVAYQDCPEWKQGEFDWPL